VRTDVINTTKFRASFTVPTVDIVIVSILH